MHQPRLELGSQAWQACILPLNYWCSLKLKQKEFKRFIIDSFIYFRKDILHYETKWEVFKLFLHCSVLNSCCFIFFCNQGVDICNTLQRSSSIFLLPPLQ